jgi:hypothetical protein
MSVTFRQRSMRTVALVIVVLAFATGIAYAAVPSATPSDPTLCLNGGWNEVQAGNGSRFSSEKACLRYVKRGGVLYMPKLVIIPQCTVGEHLASELAIFGSVFHPGAQVTLTLDGGIWASTGTNVRVTVAGAEGSFEPGVFIIQPGVVAQQYVLTLTARDSYGVTATATNSCVLS